MKLLFDENLSPRLIELLEAAFPGSAHVDQALGRGRPDAEIELIRLKTAEMNRFGESPHESLLILEP